MKIRFLLFIALLAALHSGGQIINTIAGTGISGYTGIGGPATAAEIDVTYLAVDRTGNVYLNHDSLNLVCRINTSNTITNFAGIPHTTFDLYLFDSIYHSVGEGRPATTAYLDKPWGLASDTAGNIFMCEQSGFLVSKADRLGNIFTVAGTGVPGNSGDGGPATAAEIGVSYAIATDGSGNIYFSSGNRIRKVNAAGIISTIAGNDTAGYSGDGGPATAATLGAVAAIAADGAGNVFFSDEINQRVRKISASGIITTIAGNGVYGFDWDAGPATGTFLKYPYGVAVDRTGNVYFSDQGNARIRMVNPEGYLTTIAGNGGVGYTGDGGPATAAEIGAPVDLAIDSAGNLYFNDWIIRVRKITFIKHPHFTGGRSQAFTVCENGGAAAIDNLLRVTDTAAGQNVSWSAIMAPGHGTVAAGFSMTSTGDTLTPTGLSYTPSGGYSGNDSFRVRVTDGLSADTTTVHVTVDAAGAIGGVLRVCNGASATLTDTTGGGRWSSGCTAVAVIGSLTGVVAGVAAGTASITCTIVASGCRAVATFTVNAAPAPITGATAVCRGATTTLGDLAGAGVWNSGNIAVATAGSATGLITGIATGSVTITYTLSTGCYVTATVSIDPPVPAITGVMALCTGNATTLTDSAAGGAWSSGNTAVATTGSGGVITGISSGTTAISYTLPTGCMATATVTVYTTPPPLTGPPTVCAGSAAQFTIYLTDESVGGHWTSSNTSVAAMGSSFALVDGLSAGTARITYSLGTGCQSVAPVTVLSLPPAITGVLSACVGSSVTLSDVTTGGTWASGTAAIATAGTTGMITAISAGTATISYTAPTGCMAQATFTALPLPPAITGATAICTGSMGLETDSAEGGAWAVSGPATIGTGSGLVSGLSPGAARVTYTLTTGCKTLASVNITPLPGAPLGAGQVCAGLSAPWYDSTHGGMWSSANTAYATVSGGGVVTGVSAGSVAISYEAGGCFVSRAITVNPVPGAIGGAANGCAGLISALTDPTSGGTWTSSNPAIAAVDTFAGIMTGVTGGAAVITYTLSTGCAAIAGVTVNPTPTAISGPAAVCAGSSVTLADTTGGGLWSSNDPAIATAATGGAVTGVSAGTTLISYAIGGCAATYPVTVNRLPAPITGPDSVCALGGTIRVLDTDVVRGAWASTGVTIDSSGRVTSYGAGLSTVTYTFGTGCRTVKTVTVNPLPATITGPDYVCPGGTIPLYDSGGLWSSAGYGAYATIGSATGLVTGLATGSAIITYTLPTGCSVTKMIAVNPQPLPVSGAGAFCAGTATTFTDASTGGVWSSSAPAIATAGSGGVVTGVSAGAVIISFSVTNLCGTSAATRSVTVNPQPDAGAIEGPAWVCVNASALLTETATGGLWSGSNTAASIAAGLVSGISAGTSAITYTLTNDCGTAMAYDTLTVLPLPEAGTVTGADSLCPGDTATLVSTVPGGIWATTAAQIAGVTITGLVSAIAPGVDTISYTVTNSCGSATAMYPFSVQSYSACDNAVTTIPAKTFPLVHPDPCQGEFTLSIPGVSGQTRVIITTPAGKAIQEFTTSQASVQVRLNVPAGLYFITATGISGAYYGKVVVE